MADMPAAKAKKLQEMLNQVVKPKPPLVVDGLVGKNTKDAIGLLQSKAGLKSTGQIDAETAAVITRVMKTGKIEKEQPKKFYKVGNTWVGMTEKEYAAYEKKLIRDLKSGPLAQMRSEIVGAEAEWEHIDELNRNQWFVSFCIETTRGVKLPPKSMIANARKAYEGCASALSAGDLRKFHALAPKAEKLVNDAAQKMYAYREGMIDGGGNWVTGLTFTKTGSFAFLGVFAAPVAAGALGTGVVASAVVGGAAVAATEGAASEVGNWSAGKEGWTPGGAIKRTLIDAGVGGILGVFAKGGKGGKHILEAMSAKVMPQLAKQAGFKLLSKQSLQKAVLFFLTEGGKKTLEGAVKDTALALKGDANLTLDKFIGNLANNFVSGLALAPLGKVIEGFSKNAANQLSPADKTRIWDVALKEMSRQAKGKTIHIGMIDDRSKALAEKVINDQIAKQLDNVLAVIYDNWTGPMSPQALQKEISKAVSTGSNEKKMAAEMAKVAGKRVQAAN